MNPNQPPLEGEKIRIVKLSDDKFEGQHPNGIVEGSMREGTCINNLEVGSGLLLSTSYRGFHTSVVESIDEETSTFKTMNSTYSWEFI